MQFMSFLENGQLTIALTGEIDHHRAKEYIVAISAKIEAYAPRICVLDFEQVNFVDSSAIAVVINSLRNITRIGGKMMLTGLQKQPMKGFKTSGVDKIVEIKENRL